MKYRHTFHAGNFADVHKHVTLLALIAAMQRKDKGFLYLETHSGRGAYELGEAAGESEGGIKRLSNAADTAEEIQHYLAAQAKYRAEVRNPRAYAGSPLLATRALRPQDRAVLVELLPTEARALEHTLRAESANQRIEQGNGFDLLRAWLPPQERRGLTLIDPPYEETSHDFERVTAAVTEALRRFKTGVIAAWYPIKEEREIANWQATVAKAVDCETLISELWLYPRDSRVALNGSGLLIVNPPYLIAERMRVWLPHLQAQLDLAREGGTSVRMLAPA